ncbi:MAG: hypothetical protein EBY66_05255 [Candidatus Fonsibacter lacus]|jgi:hypothetical protein|nr:hypothetical protein [Candidatus Fonsibacter lacus]
MAEIYFNNCSLSVKETYEEVVNHLYYAEQKKYEFIELNEFYPYFDATKTKMVTGTRKVCVSVKHLIYII